MIVDPMPFTAYSGDANLGSFAATDFAPGASTRIASTGGSQFPGATQTVLRISHANTKENPGILTVRSLIRLDTKYVGADGDGNPTLDKASTASVYIVVVKPDDGITTTLMMANLTKGLVSSLFASATEATYDTLKAALDTAYLTRIINGEA